MAKKTMLELPFSGKIAKIGCRNCYVTVFEGEMAKYLCWNCYFAEKQQKRGVEIAI